MILIHHIKKNHTYKEISAYKEIYTQYKENHAHKEISTYNEVYT